MRPTAASVACRDVRHGLWEYIDGALDAARAAGIRVHLERCAPCRARLDEAQALLRTVARTRHADRAPDALRERIDALLREHGLLE